MKKSFHLNQERNMQIKLHLQVKTVLSKYVDGYMSMDIDVRGQ